MICQHCGQREASLEWTRQVNGKKVSSPICVDCAAALGLYPVTLPGPGIFGYPVTGRTRRPRTLVCPACGESEAELRDKGLLGCSVCYESFADLLVPVFNRTQGRTRHLEEEKEPDPPQTDPAAELRESLRQALADEAYEEAARLRDRIRDLENPVPDDKEKELEEE